MNDKDLHIIHQYLNNEIDQNALKDSLSDEGKAYWADTIEGLDFITPSSFDTSQEYDLLLEKLNKSSKHKFKFTRLLKYAAGIILLISSTLLIRQVFNANNNLTTIASKATGINSIELPDQSKVWLNSNSTLSYDPEQWDDKRILNLNGEAYFDVAKGSIFTVETPNGKVSVLGTTFNVISNTDTFIVTCFTGKVEVRFHKNSHILNPGEAFSSLNSGVEQIEHKQPVWLKQSSTFTKAPLIEVLEDIRKIKGITITNKLSEPYFFTGAYSHDMPSEEILRLICNSLNLSLKTINDTNFEIYLTEGK